MTNLAVSTNDRIQLAFPCHLYQVTSVFIECIVVLLRILAGHSLVASHLIQSVQELILGDTVSSEDLSRWSISLIQQSQIQMLDADIFIFHFFGFFLSAEKQLLQPSCSVHGFRTAGNLRQFVDLLLYRTDHFTGVDAHEFQKFRDQSVLLHEQCQMQMFAIDLLMSFLDCNILTIDNRPLSVLCIFFYIHKSHLQ